MMTVQLGFLLLWAVLCMCQCIRHECTMWGCALCEASPSPNTHHKVWVTSQDIVHQPKKLLLGNDVCGKQVDALEQVLVGFATAELGAHTVKECQVLGCIGAALLLCAVSDTVLVDGRRMHDNVDSKHTSITNMEITNMDLNTLLAHGSMVCHTVTITQSPLDVPRRSLLRLFGGPAGGPLAGNPPRCRPTPPTGRRPACHSALKHKWYLTCISTQPQARISAQPPAKHK